MLQWCAQWGAALWARLTVLPVLGPVARAAARVNGVVTPMGRWLTLITLVSAGVALRTHWAEAWGVTLVCLVALLAAVPFALGRSRYQVTVEMTSTRVTVGDAAVGEIIVAPAGRRTGRAVLELPVGQSVADFWVPALSESETHSELFTIPTRRRGVVPIGPAATVRGDALGLVRRRQRWSDQIELYVHPRTVTLGGDVIGFMRDVEGAVTQDLSSSDVSFHALREYIPGDDRRHIHWKSVARTGRLMVRQFEETRRAHLLIVLDLNAAAWSSEEDFETGVACAASLVLAMARAGREVSLVTARGRTLTPTPVRALDALSAVEADEQVPDLVVSARRGADEVPQASVCALVTGSGASADVLHRAYASMPVSALTLLIQVDGAAPLGSRTLGGAQVLAVPDLDSLPLALRRLA